jgi:hypothetical protein
MKIGDKVLVMPGTMDLLRRHGMLADYITDSVDGMVGTVVADHRDSVITPHWGVDLGFLEPVGIPVALIVIE